MLAHTTVGNPHESPDPVESESEILSDVVVGDGAFVYVKVGGEDQSGQCPHRTGDGGIR